MYELMYLTRLGLHSDSALVGVQIARRGPSGLLYEWQRGGPALPGALHDRDRVPCGAGNAED